MGQRGGPDENRLGALSILSQRYFFFSTNNNSQIFQRDLEIIFSERQSMLFKVLRSAVGRRSASEFSSFNARFGFLINTFFYFKQHFSQSGITV